MNSYYLVECEKCERVSDNYDWTCEGCKRRFQARMFEAKNTVWARYDRSRNMVTLEEEAEE